MKPSAAELKRARTQPPPGIRLLLLHGADEAAAREAAYAYAAAWGDPAAPLSRVELPAAALAAEPSRLADEAASFSMFGGARVILVLGAGEPALEAVTTLLAAGVDGDPVVLTAGNLSAVSKLRATCDSARAAWSVAFPALSGRDAEAALIARARALGLQPDPAATAAILAMTNGESGLLARELEKYALYLDAAPAAPQPLTPDTVAAVGAGLAEPDFGALVTAVATGRVRDAAREIAAFERTGQSPIGPLRAAQKRYLQAYEQHPGPAGEALDALLDAERACKSSGNPGDVVGYQALLRIAQKAAR